MKQIAFALAMFFSALCATAYADDQPLDTWRVVFAHDNDGVALTGSKDDLIEAVRSGKPVRVYFSMGRVEHTAEALFLTVFQGEVFAQTEEINTQRPVAANNEDELSVIQFREAGQKWRMILGTNGYFSAFADGDEAPSEIQMAGRWFVQD